MILFQAFLTKSVLKFHLDLILTFLFLQEYFFFLNYLKNYLKDILEVKND